MGALDCSSSFTETIDVQRAVETVSKDVVRTPRRSPALRWAILLGRLLRLNRWRGRDVDHVGRALLAGPDLTASLAAIVVNPGIVADMKKLFPEDSSICLIGPVTVATL